MADDRKISLCIPTWNRVEMLFESFENIINDERVDEICISDDHSNSETWNGISSKYINNKKVNLYRNGENIGCYRNKMTSVFMAKNEWCILLDSDNVIDSNYLNQIFKYKYWDEHTIYTPDFASPTFDFRHFSGLLITHVNVKSWIDEPMFETMLNACNYFVNKNEYLKVFDGSIDPVTSDSIYFCYKWLESGNRIQVVEGLKYFHRVHLGSHYQNNVRRTPNGLHQSILNKLRQLT